MHPIRRALLAALFAGGMVALTAVPAGAGVVLTVSGTATCDPSTATTTIAWTINDVFVTGATVVATQTPSGETLTVTTNPLSGGANTATGTVPGTTVGVVTLSVAVVGGSTFQGTVDVGACPTPAAAVQGTADFTG
jgi:hypothetical protein